MQPTEQLDTLLSYLAKFASSKPPTRSVPVIIADIKTITTEINETDIYLILKKLEKDGYAESYRDNTKDVRFFNITFEGKVFNELNGYTQQLINISEDRIKNSKNQSDVRESQRSTERLSWILAIGTAILALVALLEYLKGTC